MFRNLQAEQARKGMTNQQVADYLGISRTSYENKKKQESFMWLKYLICANCLIVLTNIYLQQMSRNPHRRNGKEWGTGEKFAGT